MNLDGREPVVLIQPEEEEIPLMSEQKALQLVKRDAVWATFLEDFGATEDGVNLGAKECSRCWVIVATVAGAQIPPGGAFVVDKYSGRVFARRYADVIGATAEIAAMTRA